MSDGGDGGNGGNGGGGGGGGGSGSGGQKAWSAKAERSEVSRAERVWSWLTASVTVAPALPTRNVRKPSSLILDPRFPPYPRLLQHHTRPLDCPVPPPAATRQPRCLPRESARRQVQVCTTPRHGPGLLCTCPR